MLYLEHLSPGDLCQGAGDREGRRDGPRGADVALPRKGGVRKAGAGVRAQARGAYVPVQPDIFRHGQGMLFAGAGLLFSY